MMLESIFLSRWGNSIVMLVVLGIIVLLLRGLFGPRGLLRDPYWDKRNQEIRAEETAAREARQRAWRQKYHLPDDKAPAASERTPENKADKRSDEDSHEH